MKRFLKRSVALIISVCMIMGLLCCEAFAANTSFNTAKSISANTSYSDSINSNGNKNYYKFTLSEAGYITLDFSHNYVDTSNSLWESHIYNANCEELYTLEYYKGNTKATNTSTKLGLPAGTYYIVIVPVYNGCIGVSYSLKVNFTASSVWEKEQNGSFDTANKIKTGTTYNGSIMYYGTDKDYYRFTLDKKGYITFSFQHGYQDTTGYCWVAYLYNADCEQLYTLNYYKGNTKAATSTTKIGLPAGTYYILICHSDYYSTAPYKFKVNFTASSVWETELNNSFDTTDTMKMNSYINGSLVTYSDYDYYKIKVPKTQYVKLCFKHKALDSSSECWKVSMYNNDCVALGAEYYIRANDASFSGDKIKLKAGTYYIRVEDADGWSDVPYSVELKTYVAAPTVKSVTNNSGSIKVKWSKVAAADGYKVYRKKGNGDWTLVKTTTSNETLSYTDKNISNGTKYKYKVCAYKDVNGTNVFSAYSNIKTIYRLAQPTISSASNSGAKKITVKWKENSKATGYQVKYVVGSTTKTVKTTNLSKTISDLKKGSTYKVYVRAYKTVSGNTYYSAYSSCKSVKITK